MKYSSEVARELLLRHFGHESLRDGQEDIIRSITEGCDTLVVMPTGGGKSLCYQMPALIYDGVALVVSPLIALMQDQVDALIRARVPAAFINSSLSQEEIAFRLSDARAGRTKLLYIAPERLTNRLFLEELRTLRASFIAVDEAHCVSEWGHDFRPAYLQIPSLFKIIGRVPIIALTATATAEVRSDIIHHLEMRRAKAFIRGFDRPNLTYNVEFSQNKAERIGDILSETKEGSTIIYCGSRKRADEFAAKIREFRHYALVYHAGLPDARRQYAQDEFLSGNCKTLVATSAFGMGIDKPDVRNVIHCDLTLTLEAYYQEAGRAGRDGLPAQCTMLHHNTDRRLMEYFIRSAYPESKQIRAVYDFLYELSGTPIGAKATSPILLDNKQIAARTHIPETSVSAVMSLFELRGIIRRTKANPLGLVQFTTSHERIKDYFHNTTDERRKTLSALLRSVGALALDGPAEIDVREMMAKHDIDREVFEPAIRALEIARILRFHQPGKDGGLTLALERMPFEWAPIDLDALRRRRERAFQKLDVVERYSQTAECKRNFILSYFDDNVLVENCGRCSSCLTPRVKQEKKSKSEEFLLQIILSACSELDGRFGKKTLLDVVMGEMTPKVKSSRLDGLQSFGLANKFARSKIEEVIDYGLSERLLRYSAELYPVISLTEEGARRAISLIKPVVLPKSEHKSPPPGLLAKLWQTREEYARQDGIRADALASNEILEEIALTAPATIRDLLKTPNIPPAFAARCGHGIVEAIRAWNLAEDNRLAPERMSDAAKTTLAMAKLGKSLQTIGEEQNITVAAVSRHLESAIQAGANLERALLVPDALYKQVKTALRRNPSLLLKDLRGYMNVKYDFPELRVAAAFVRREIIVNDDLNE